MPKSRSIQFRLCGLGKNGKISSHGMGATEAHFGAHVFKDGSHNWGLFAHELEICGFNLISVPKSEPLWLPYMALIIRLHSNISIEVLLSSPNQLINLSCLLSFLLERKRHKAKVTGHHLFIYSRLQS